MVRTTTEADDRVEYVNKNVDRAIDDHDVEADFDGATVIGTGEDGYVSATITFDPDTTPRDVARVRRSLPMSFDRTIDFRGGDTLMIRIRVGDTGSGE